MQPTKKIIHFTSNFRTILKKSGTRLPKIELEEIGPRFNLRIRRTNLATNDLYKQACKKPKEVKVIFLTIYII